MGNECCDGRRQLNDQQNNEYTVVGSQRRQAFDQFEDITSSRKNSKNDSLHGINYDQIQTYQHNNQPNNKTIQNQHNIFDINQNQQTQNNQHNYPSQQNTLQRKDSPFDIFQSNQQQNTIVKESQNQEINAESFQKENDIDDQQKFLQNKPVKTSNIFLKDNDLAQLKLITESQFQKQDYTESDFQTFTNDDQNRNSDRGQIRMSNFEQLPNDSEVDIKKDTNHLEPIQESREIEVNNQMIESYTGEKLNGKPHGQGKLIFKNGNIYEGELYNGEMQGKGKLEKPNEFIYDGYFVDNKFEGYGTKIYTDGRIFKGEFKGGKEQGVGVLTGPDQKVISRGIWINGNFQG